MTDQRGETTSDPYVRAGAGDAWSADAAARGKSGSQRLLDVSVTAEVPASVRTALRLNDTDRVVRRRRLMLLDDRPVEIATSYYPASIAADSDLASPGKIRGGAVAALAAIGHAPADVVEQIIARHPEADEAELLDVEWHEPILVLTRTNVDAAGQAVEHAVNCMVARLCGPLTYRMRRSAT
ncbi:UTRA domain-containing protein [Krasilnikovia cinnamomea]|uniref:UTRA domain-containing protein n=1 Tax=Krasilnikovia cinnamomea TaxID=349313 RepID=A0A4Q7ZKN0_9ACTN|nr:UTRA domain-containing protein [Krasilnikovia cinnamomea]RZU51101.1 UTRA domain-containing protein [Krasilnikovia cinnamomea]